MELRTSGQKPGFFANTTLHPQKLPKTRFLWFWCVIPVNSEIGFFANTSLQPQKRQKTRFLWF
jgi:hypothetical protein